MRYSELFNINPSQLDRLGVFNANVNEDSNLHIDQKIVQYLNLKIHMRIF